MIEIIKTSTVCYICYKSLVCFGKKDYGDIIAFVSVLYIGVMIYSKVDGWYINFMSSSFMQFMQKLFN